MKIGEFSKICNITKDTIRYYIKIGLITPSHEKNNIKFSLKDINDIKYIQELKKMEFNIKEIQEILKLKRISNWIEPDIMEDYIKILKIKKEYIVAKIINLESSLEKLDIEISKYSSIHPKPGKKIGVPLTALNLLACPNCKKQLNIENATINNNSIFQGNLTCSCGYEANIKDGILITKNKYTNIYDSPDLQRGLYKNLGNSFSMGFQKCSNFILNKLKKLDLNNKVILEANVNGYFFLYNHFTELDNNCLYIIHDKFPEMLIMYKKLIEYLNLDLNILFIADNSVEYPLKNNCVDILISFFGETEFQLYHNMTYIKATKKFYKNNIKVLGAYISIDKNSKTRKLILKKYPEAGKEYSYNFAKTQEEYQKENFNLLCNKFLVNSNATLNFASSCYSEKDPLYLYTFLGEKVK